jgi:GT2 family glycosyltransferase
MDDDMLVQPDSFLKIIPLVELVKEGCLNLNWIYPVSVTKRRDHEPFVRYLNHYGFDSLEGWSRSSTDWDHQKIFKVNGITSQFLVVRKTVFNSVNGYNTSFPFAGYEDYDLSERIMQKGINIYIDPNNMIFHNEEDRLVVENWLQRKMRGAVTRKVAVSLGHQALTLHYPLLKKVFYRMVYSFRTPILYMLNHWPKSTKLDRFYFLLINVMLGSYSCEGYTKK